MFGSGEGEKCSHMRDGLVGAMGLGGLGAWCMHWAHWRAPARRVKPTASSRRSRSRVFSWKLEIDTWAHPGLDGLRARAVAQGNARESEASPFSHVHAQQPLPSHVVLSSCIAVSLPAPSASAANSEAPEMGDRI